MKRWIMYCELYYHSCVALVRNTCVVDYWNVFIPTDRPTDTKYTLSSCCWIVIGPEHCLTPFDIYYEKMDHVLWTLLSFMCCFGTQHLRGRLLKCFLYRPTDRHKITQFLDSFSILGSQSLFNWFFFLYFLLLVKFLSF